MHKLTTNFALAALVAGCVSDPGDVGDLSAGDDGGGKTQGGSDGADDGGPGDGGPGSGGGSTMGGEDSATGEGSDGPVGESSSATTDGGGNTDTGGGTGGLMPVVNCTQCDPGEMCVIRTAFMTEYFCAAVPAACGAGDPDCACSGHLCTQQPIYSCFENAAPNTINCECLAC